MTTFVVTGRHRTGTSMMMLALSQSISNVITDDAMETLIRSREADPAYDPNPNGYFSAPPNVVPTDYPNALVKCPMYRWPQVPTAGLLIVHMQRDETERSASFTQAFGFSDIVNVPFYEAGEAVIAQLPNVVVVQFADMITDPLFELNRLVLQGWPIDPVACNAIVDPTLWRIRG